MLNLMYSGTEQEAQTREVACQGHTLMRAIPKCLLPTRHPSIATCPLQGPSIATSLTL